LLADALNETVVVTIDGRRRKITKREAIVGQMIDKSATADLRATKMLFDMMKDAGLFALIEMLDALLSLDPNLSAKQKRKRSYEIMARALQRLERKDA
jgi:Family of unknown function (DUF5681)